MSANLNYKKAEYESVINQLDTYYSQLSTHLETLEGLKDQINEFWINKSAEESIEALREIIKDVKAKMDEIQQKQAYLKSVIEQIDAKDENNSNLIEEALKVLKGIF